MRCSAGASSASSSSSGPGLRRSRVRAAAAAAAIALATNQSAGAQPLAPGAVLAEHELEQRWSEGGLWRLLPLPSVLPRLQIRVGEGYQVRALHAPGESVLVIWLPHAAGTGTGSEIVARLVADRGWAVTSLLPPPDLPAPGAALDDWVSLLEERVRAGRAAFRMAEGGPGCVVVMGVSAGGIAALRVAELEPEVDAVVAMLAGSGVEGLAHAARAYGASSEPASNALASRLHALDPTAHASRLRGRQVLLVRALFDRVVPDAAFSELRTALRDPEVDTYPTGHESFVYVLPLAVERALDWARQACQASPEIP